MMENKKSNDKDSSAGVDASSGNIWVRSVKLLLERLGKKTGEKLGTTETAQRLFSKVEAHVGSKDLSRLLEGAAFIGPVLLQDKIFASVLQRGLGLSPILAKEVSNEALDSLLESFFDKVRTARDKNGKEQNTALQSAVRDFEEEAKALLKATFPEMFEEVLHVLATNRAHKLGCTLAGTVGPAVVKRTLYDVQQLDGDMTHECACVDARTDPSGSFQQAYRRLGTIEQSMVDELLVGPFQDIRKMVLAHKAETGKITTEDIRSVITTADETLQKERLMALLGITLEKSKSPLEMISDIGKHGIETLSDHSKRASFRESTVRATTSMRRVRDLIRNIK